MAKRSRDLLDEIEQAVLNESTPITKAPLKCVSLGGHAGSAELRELHLSCGNCAVGEREALEEGLMALGVRNAC
jgi:hypothetical protein